MPRQVAAATRVRRRGERGATHEKHAAILDAARRLFFRDGFDTTTMDAIAICAAVSKATVYAHFGNKDALFRAILAAMLDELPDRWDALLASRAPLRRRLAAVAHDLMDIATGPLLQASHRMLVPNQFLPQRTGGHWDLCYARYDCAMQRFLRTEHGRGTLAIADVAHASAQFFGLVVGAPALRALLTGAAPVAQWRQASWVDDAVELFLRGYRAAPALRRRDPGRPFIAHPREQPTGD